MGHSPTDLPPNEAADTAASTSTRGRERYRRRRFESGRNRSVAIALSRVAGALQPDIDALLARTGLFAPLAGAGAPTGAAARMGAVFERLGAPEQALLLAVADRLAAANPGAGAEARRTGSGASGLGAGRRVLLVDDDADARRVAAMMLRKAGFETVVAPSSDEAYALLATNGPFDALVTDYAMPGLTGLGLIELALEREPELPAMIVTGYARDADLRRKPASVQVLAKPFTRLEFIQRVERLVAGRQVVARAQASEEAV